MINDNPLDPKNQERLRKEAEAEKRAAIERQKFEEEKQKKLKRSLIEGKIRTLEAQIRKDEININGLQREVATLDTKGRKARLGAPPPALARVKTDLANFTEEERELDMSLRRLQIKEQMVKSEVERIEQATRLESQNAGIKQKGDVQISKIESDTVRGELSRDAIKRAEIERKAEKARRELAAAESELTRLDQEIKSLHAKELLLRKSAGSTAAAKPRATSRLTSGNRALDTKKLELANTAKQKAELEKKRDGLDQKIRDLKREQEKLEKETSGSAREEAISATRSRNRERELQLAEHEAAARKRELATLRLELSHLR